MDDDRSRAMNPITRERRYSVAELVAAAYKAATQVTRNRVLAGMIVSKILEDWLMQSDRQDLVKRLQSVST
jgi:hypothetical protein